MSMNLSSFFTQSSPEKPSFIMQILPIGLIFGVFYLLVIRPQSKKLREHQKLLKAIKPGDKVVTSSGIYATVRSLGDEKEDIVKVEISKNTEIFILRSAISKVLSKNES